MSGKLELQVFADDIQKEDCSAYCVLFELISQGNLWSYDSDEISNCYKVALGLLKDLGRAGFDTSEWRYVIGDCKPPQGEHAWLEYDGWAVDFSSGKQHIARVDEFARVKEPRNVRRYTAAQVEELKQSSEGRVLLGYTE